MTVTTLVAGPSRDPNARPLDHNGESAFCEFLTSAGYAFSYEPMTFPLERERSGKSGERLTPDIRIDRLPGGQDVSHLMLFVELTEADRYLKADDLPSGVRRKNRSHSRSRREYISPEEYLRLKRRKIKRATAQYHDLTVLLLPHYEQLSVMATPPILERQLRDELGARAGDALAS